MSRLIIEGGNKLSGKIAVSGNKNSILPCIVASLLTDEEVILKNASQISDAEVMLEILESLGAFIRKEGDTISIKAREIKTHILPPEFTSKLRASVLIAGALLGRLGKVEFMHPGGDVIGKRSIDLHIAGFQALGFSFEVNDRSYKGEKSSKFTYKKEIFLEQPTVTGTENIILASVLGDFEVVIRNCAKEPHVSDLCKLLIKMGAKIEGVGESTLKITGVKKLNGCEFRIGSDYIEMATYAAAAVLTKGHIEISNCNLEGLETIVSSFKKIGVDLVEKTPNSVTVSGSRILPVPDFPGIVVGPWPGFPTDLMSIFIVLATQANGLTLLHDWMYETRMFFVDKLISMGANITIADPHRVLVYGPSLLKGRDLETPDIRAGMSLVLAALCAKGTSTIHRAELIERGYEEVVQKLSSLGASIQKVD